jgi:hypothetical protein
MRGTKRIFFCWPACIAYAYNHPDGTYVLFIYFNEQLFDCQYKIEHLFDNYFCIIYNQLKQGILPVFTMRKNGGMGNASSRSGQTAEDTGFCQPTGGRKGISAICKGDLQGGGV